MDIASTMDSSSRGDSAPSGRSAFASGSSSEQLLRLCRHILQQDNNTTADDRQVSGSLIDERVKSSFRNSVRLLSKSQSAQEDVTINEFSVAEKIKKYLVCAYTIK